MFSFRSKYVEDGIMLTLIPEQLQQIGLRAKRYAKQNTCICMVQKQQFTINAKIMKESLLVNAGSSPGSMLVYHLSNYLILYNWHVNSGLKTVLNDLDLRNFKCSQPIIRWGTTRFCYRK